MPSDTVIITPNGEKLVFNESFHSYKLGGRLCTSVTKFVSQFFEPFDQKKISYELAVKRGCSQNEILNEWEYIRNRGTAIHETCEDVLKGRPEFRFSPSTDLEKKLFECAKTAAKGVFEKLSEFSPEFCIADSMHNLAGTTDLVGTLKSPTKTGCTHLLLDWKTNTSLSQFGFKGQTGFGPCSHIPDSNWWHYALQLSMYEYILKQNGYYPEDTKFKRCIVHFRVDYDEASAVYYDMPDLTDTVVGMLRHKVK